VLRVTDTPNDPPATPDAADTRNHDAPDDAVQPPTPDTTTDLDPATSGAHHETSDKPNPPTARCDTEPEKYRADQSPAGFTANVPAYDPGTPYVTLCPA
jgi:hypothetical protein